MITRSPSICTLTVGSLTWTMSVPSEVTIRKTVATKSETLVNPAASVALNPNTASRPTAAASASGRRMRRPRRPPEFQHRALPRHERRPDTTAAARLSAAGCARALSSKSATSVAVWNRSAGSLASSRSIMASSQSGTSGLISRIGRWRRRRRVEDGHRRVGPERRPPRGHRIKSGPKREQIGASVDRLAPGLLGGHVLRRSRDHAALRQAGVVDGPGQAEVGELHPLNTIF